MSLTIKELTQNKAVMRPLSVIIAILFAGLVLTVIVAVVISLGAGLLFLLIYLMIAAVIAALFVRKRQRYALRLNGQGVITKTKLVSTLTMQAVEGDRVLEYKSVGDSWSVFVSGLHKNPGPHYHCTLTLLDDSDAQRTGMIHVTTHLYLIKLDSSPIMKTMRVGSFSVRNSFKAPSGTDSRSEQADRYDMAADDQELTRLLHAVQEMPQPNR